MSLDSDPWEELLQVIYEGAHQLEVYVLSRVLGLSTRFAERCLLRSRYSAIGTRSGERWRAPRYFVLLTDPCLI